MPNTTYGQLQFDVQIHFGSKIDKVSQLKLLQQNIEFNTGKLLSFNTLRRFFGFLDYTKPNLNTLNTLSEYLGYYNYSFYNKNNLKYKEWNGWNEIIKIELSNTFDEENIVWLQSQINTDDYHLKIASIFKTFVYRKNYTLLNSFFDTRLFQVEHKDRGKLSLNICLFFRSLDSISMNYLIKLLSPNIVFRETILHWFIDYSYLNKGYYGKFLRNSIPFLNTNSHEALFVDLMINYNYYLSGKSNLKLIAIDKIQDDFFIVLKGRCYAYNLIYYAEQTNTVEYEKTWEAFLKIITQKEQINLLTIEIFPALILLKDFKKTNYLIQKYYEDVLTLVDWSGYHVQAAILLAMTVNSINENKIKDAIVSYNFIEKSKFSPAYADYILLLKLLAKYKLGLANSISESDLKEIESQYVSIVNKTGFKRFTVDFLKNY